MDKQSQNQQLKPNKPSQKDKISLRIKGIRAEKGISQTDLAEKLGVERSNYHRMENRGEKLTYEFLDKIAKALDVPVLQLLTDTAEIEPVAALEVNKLLARINELEDRLKDKQDIAEWYKVGKREFTNLFYDTLYSTALEMKMFEESIADDAETDRASQAAHDVWGVTRKNNQNEKVLILGEGVLALTMADLLKIYEYLWEKHKYSQINTYHLIGTMVFEANMLDMGLAREALTKFWLGSFLNPKKRK